MKKNLREDRWNNFTMKFVQSPKEIWNRNWQVGNDDPVKLVAVVGF